jgi:Bacterial SH3 domain
VNPYPARAALLALLAAAASLAPGAARPDDTAAAPPGQPTAPAQSTAAAAPAAGEVRYVIEQLAVNVNSAADGTGTRVATLRSGDKVQLLERSGEAAHIRLASGRDGWVRASYLSEAEPLRVQLAARTAEVASLKQQLQALSAARAPAAAAPPAAALAPAGAAAPAPADQPAAGEDAGEDPGGSHGLPWGWLTAVALVSLGAGFAVGWLVLDARIRRRYGGLRIY